MKKSAYDIDPKHGERIAGLEATLPYLAKKEDIERLNGKIETGVSDLNGKIGYKCF